MSVKDIKSGVLPSNLLDMFSDMKKAKAFGIIVNNSPLVFYRTYQRMQVRDVWKHVLVIRLGLAPHSVEGFDIGTFVPLANLFIEHSNKHVTQMVKVLMESVSPKDLDEVKRLTHDLAVTEGRILEAEAEAVASPHPEPAAMRSGRRSQTSSRAGSGFRAIASVAHPSPATPPRRSTAGQHPG